MKQVTMESVKQRIADLESAGKVVGGLSLSSEFELACLRELVAVTEQRDALVVENVKFKSAAKETLAHWAAAEPSEMESMMDKCMPALRVAYCETPATDAAIAALRAEGIEQWIASRNGAWNGTTKQAEEFARQLRDSKGANHA